MRSRKEILAAFEHLAGSRQGESLVLQGMLEVLLDIRELLGVELYLTPPVSLPVNNYSLPVNGEPLVGMVYTSDVLLRPKEKILRGARLPVGP